MFEIGVTKSLMIKGKKITWHLKLCENVALHKAMIKLKHQLTKLIKFDKTEVN